MYTLPILEWRPGVHTVNRTIVSQKNRKSFFGNINITYIFLVLLK